MVIFIASAINKKYGVNKRSEMADRKMSNIRFIMIDLRTEFNFDHKITGFIEELM